MLVACQNRIFKNWTFASVTKVQFVHGLRDEWNHQQYRYYEVTTWRSAVLVVLRAWFISSTGFPLIVATIGFCMR